MSKPNTGTIVKKRDEVYKGDKPWILAAKYDGEILGEYSKAESAYNAQSKKAK